MIVSHKHKKNGVWELNDSVMNHLNDEFVEESRIPLNDSKSKEYVNGRYDVYDPRWIMEYNGYLLI